MERPPERRFFVLFTLYWLPVLLYVTMMLALSSRPYLTPPFEFKFGDKVLHVLEYFVLGILFVRALRATMRIPLPLVAALAALAFDALSGFAWLVIFGIVVGTGEEYLQSFVPGRVSSPFDLLADTVGLALAQIVYLAFTRE